MNELEKEIYKEGLEYTLNNADKFRQGCEFIREKNLPVLFAEWFDNFELDGDLYNEYYCLGSLQFGSIKEAYDYWLNNVYGT